MQSVTISDGPLSIEELLAVVEGSRVELAPAARDRIAAGRAAVDRALASGDAVYGLTTQVGHGKDQRLTEEEIRGQQQFLVLSHSGGFGPPLPTELVRAALTVRLNGIARGGSGASPAVADTLAAMLNAGVHPVVPETSSVGTGDLAHLAGMAQVAIGMGRAEHRGEVLPGGEALRRAGITPLVLEGKDGLALISANAVSVGHAALVVERAARVAEAADAVAALSMEATGANPSIVDPAVGRAKPFPGQVAAADHLRGLLHGSPLLEPGGARSVQDALSFRVVPQVHGALREHVTAARRAVAVELNGTGDNPLVSLPDGAMVSNGNFHPVVLAIAFDALRVAAAQVGQLSERRMSHLWDAFFAQMAGGGPPPSGPLLGLQLRYPAGALFPELKQMAAPATLDSAPLDMGLEDHATNAPLTVRKTDQALGLLEDLLAIELLLARDVLTTSADRRTPGTGAATTAAGRAALGTGARAALQTVEESIAAADPTPDAVHRALRARFPAPRQPVGAPASHPGDQEVAAGAGQPYALALDEVEVGRYRAMAEQARVAEADLWRRAGIVEGAVVADVGCGPGALLSALAEAVGQESRVAAVDADPVAVAKARALAGAAGLDQVTVQQGRADRTGLAAGSFDVVMLRHVLAHNGGAEDAIVAHLATLLRPGGCLYLVDVDGTALRTVPEDPDLVDLNRRYVALHESRGNDIRAGLHLGERLTRAGLDLVEFRGAYIVEPLPPGLRNPPWAARDALVRAGLATEDDVARWAAAFARSDTGPARPTLFAPMFVAIGRCT